MHYFGFGVLVTPETKRACLEPACHHDIMGTVSAEGKGGLR